MSWTVPPTIEDEAFGGLGVENGVSGGTSVFTTMAKSSRTEQKCDLNPVGLSNRVALPMPHLQDIANSQAFSEVLWH